MSASVQVQDTRYCLSQFLSSVPFLLRQLQSAMHFHKMSQISHFSPSAPGHALLPFYLTKHFALSYSTQQPGRTAATKPRFSQPRQRAELSNECWIQRKEGYKSSALVSIRSPRHASAARSLQMRRRPLRKRRRESDPPWRPRRSGATQWYRCVRPRLRVPGEAEGRMAIPQGQ